jgi:hypothetical protein
MRGTVRAAAPVALAALLAAGCGTARPRPATDGSGVGAGDKPRPAAASGPATITRADAGRLAQTLLARAVVPGGAHLLAGRAPSPVGQSPGWTAGSPSLGRHRIWTVTEPVSTVYDLISRHVPTGMTSAGTGQSGTSAGVSQEFVSYRPRQFPAGVNQAILTMTVAPSGTGTLLRADVQVIWYPPRSAAEYVPAGMRAVTITASYASLAAPRTVSKTFTSAALIGRLAAMLNGAYASPGGETNCPMERVSYKLAFAPSRTAAPYLVATVGGCGFVAVTVAGHQQPALQEPAALSPALSRLIGRPTDLPRSARIPPTQ